MGHEVKLKGREIIFTRTDLKGNLLFGNDVFEKISGFENDQYIGKSHNIIRHQDMPKIIFKIMWESIKEGNDMNAIIKNKTINGDYYWVATHFETEKDPSGKIVGYQALRTSVSTYAKKEVKKLYEALIDIEMTQGIEKSEKYLTEFLSIKEQTFNEYMYELIENKSFVEKHIIK